MLVTVGLSGERIYYCTAVCWLLQGPPEKPGIFVQSTKAGRLAREVGLRPGDQILECNGVHFHGLDFGEAVYHLKVKGTGTFPPPTPQKGIPLCL